MIQLKKLKGYQPSNFECIFSFYSKTVFTFLLLLITFEPLELKQSYIPHLKVLMCVINALGVIWWRCTFMLCYTDLNLALLLHKIALLMFLLASAVTLQKSLVLKMLFYQRNDNYPKIQLNILNLFLLTKLLMTCIRNPTSKPWKLLSKMLRTDFNKTDTKCS